VDFLWTKHIWLIPFWPALGALANGVLIPRRRKTLDLVSTVAIGSVAMSFLCAVFLTAELASLRIGNPAPVEYFRWIDAGDLRVPFALLFDPLSATMCLMVTGVGLLIHIYSRGYMADDPDPGRFFAYLNLFMAMMLLLLLADSFLLMFVGWEGVGLCSYLLIGFWHRKESANRAGLKAFLVNRVGDAGFLLAMMLIFVTFGSLRFDEVLSNAAIRQASPTVLFAITALLFVGATGKSAQLPLHIWLPDAMEGPTPVSALIHAATMVTAGVYVVVRCAALYSAEGAASALVAWVGVITALFASLIALAQTDIKRVLAYSTISQLGYMFLACGVGAYVAAILHVVTHAFFKACLFLGAGSVMHGTGGQTDIRKMGGLAKTMPRTTVAFWIACLSIAGIAPLAGFVSKDEILHHVFVSAYAPARALWALAIVTALLTAVYMFRLFALTFHGDEQAAKRGAHAHESPSVMTVPLLVLAALAIVGGLVLGLPYPQGLHLLNQFMRGWLIIGPHHGAEDAGGLGLTLALAAVALAVAVSGAVFAFRFFCGPYRRVEQLQRRLGFAHTLLSRKFYVDELYDIIIVGPAVGLSRLAAEVADVRGIDGIVHGMATVAYRAGEGLRRLQTSHARVYALAMLVGAVALVLYLARSVLF